MTTTTEDYGERRAMVINRIIARDPKFAERLSRYYATRMQNNKTPRELSQCANLRNQINGEIAQELRSLKWDKTYTR